MKTLRDVVSYYAELDTLPLLLALEKMSASFAELGVIGLFNFYITLPQVAWSFVHRESSANGKLCLLNEKLYKSFKDHMVGGPVIVFRRVLEVNKSILKEQIYGDDKGEVAKQLVSLDVNALCEFSQVYNFLD